MNKFGISQHYNLISSLQLESKETCIYAQIFNIFTGSENQKKIYLEIQDIFKDKIKCEIIGSFPNILQNNFYLFKNGEIKIIEDEID